MSTVDIGLRREQLDLICRIISKTPSIYKAVIFGSRAKGTFKKYSDVDIAVFGGTDSDASEIAMNLDEENIIYKFDILAYESIENQKLKEHIDR